MTRRRAIAVAAAVALVAIAAWLLTRDQPPAASATSAAPAAPERVTPAAPASRPVAAPTPAGVPAEYDDPAPVIDATHAAVHAVGRRCWTARTPREVPAGQPDDSVGRMELRLSVAVAGGQAIVTDSEVVSTRRLTAELRDCIVAGVTAASWPVAAPDGEATIVELFRMGDYLLPDPDRQPPTPPAAPPRR